jgi:prepilin-type N-terminal cleavage/methylation domain-containing protein
MHKVINNKKLNGFSLFEVLITIGILLMLSVFVFPVTIQKVQENKLESYVNQMVTDIYYQQQQSYYKNSAHGVSIDSNGYTLFDGESLSTATESTLIQYPRNIQLFSITFPDNEFFFPAGEFRPSFVGEIRFTNGLNYFRVNINEEGLVDYDVM